MNYYPEEEPPQFGSCSHLMPTIDEDESSDHLLAATCDASISGGTYLQPSFI